MEVDAEALRALGRALRAEADGKQLRRDLIRELKEPLKPAVAEIRSGVMSLSSSGLPHAGESLRRGVARRITTEVKLSGKFPGVRVKARKTPGLRQFANAPKRLNSPKGWRRRVFGRDVWVTQIGKPHYFDDPLQGRKQVFRRAVEQAMERTAGRILQRSGR